MARGRPSRQPRAIQTPGQEGAGHRSSSKTRHSHRHAPQHREAGRDQTEVAMRHYIGIIHKDKKSDFGISFPDFPGCISAGKTLDDARASGEDALAFHVRGMIEDGLPIPSPSNLEKTMRKPDFRDG